MDLRKENSETFLELNILNNQTQNEVNTQIQNEVTLDLGIDECSICLDEINYALKKNIYILPCLHAYHESCIYEWFHKKKEYICPICRKVFGDYPVEPYVEEPENTEPRRTCFGFIKVETIFISVFLLVFWSIMFFAVIYTR